MLARKEPPPIFPLAYMVEPVKPNSVDAPTMEPIMTVFRPRSLAFAFLLAALPTGVALGAGGGAGAGDAAAGSSAGAGATGGGVGAAGMGSAAVGGGAPAGRVGGGPPAGAVGGGAPGSTNPAGNGAAGTGDPALNAAGVKSLPAENPASGLEAAPTTGGVIGENIGAGGASPPMSGQARSNPVAPKTVEGVAEQLPSSTVGRAEPGPDGVSTRIVAPRPCSTAAHETDGTTTCVGIPARQ